MAIELTPFQREALRRAPKKLRELYANGSAKEKKTFLEAVEQRFRDLENQAKKASSKSLSKPKPEGPPKPKDPPKPKPNKPPRASDNARKVKGKVVDTPKATKPRRGVVREINKVKPEPKIEKLKPEKPKVKIEKDIDLGPDKTKSQKVRKILGKGAKQVIKKVAAPLAVLDAAHLAVSEDAQQGAKDDFDAMGDDTAALRAVKSVLEPADTIYAAVSALRDAGANVSEPDLDQIRLDTAVRGGERRRELEKRYAAMSPEEQAVYDENRSAYKESQRARQLKRVMENRAAAKRRVENKNSTTPLPDDGSEYFFRDREGRGGYYTPKGYLEETEYIAAAQKAAADKAAAEKAAAEKAAADKVAAEEDAIAEAAAEKAAAAASEAAAEAFRIKRNPFHKAEQVIKARQEEQSRQAKQAEQAARQAEYAEFRDSSAEDYIKKLEQETASRRAILNKPLPEINEVAAPASEVDYERQAIRLFKDTHGASFDPNSRMDEGKLEKMKSMISEMGGLGKMSANEFAIQFHRNP